MNGLWLIGLAAAGGILSFASPCVLPLVPGYIAFITGTSLAELKETDPAQAAHKALVSGLFFVLGFTVVFAALGASASAVGVFLKAYQRSLALVAGIVLIILGLHTAGVLRIPLLMLEKRAALGGKRLGALGIFATGALFAFGWSPCVGPILTLILAEAATQDTAWKGVGLLVAYSLGLGVPFLLAGLFFNGFLRLLGAVKRGLRAVELVTAALLIGVGALMASGQLSRLSSLIPPSRLELLLTSNIKPELKAKAGDWAPDITFKTLDGRVIRLRDLRGKAVLINFWAPWCVPCREEIPVFLEYYHKYRWQGFELIGVAESSPEIESVKRYVKDMHMDYPIVYDEDYVVNDALKGGGRELPRSVLIDRRGRIILKHTGIIDGENLENLIRQALMLEPLRERQLPTKNVGTPGVAQSSQSKQ